MGSLCAGYLSRTGRIGFSQRCGDGRGSYGENRFLGGTFAEKSDYLADLMQYRRFSIGAVDF